MKIRLKKQREYKTNRINFRCTKLEYAQIKKMALLFSGGNISEYALYAATHFRVMTSDLE